VNPIWLVLATAALADDPSDVDSPPLPGRAVNPDVEETIGEPAAQTAEEADLQSPYTDKLLRVGEETRTAEPLPEQDYIEVLVIGQQQITAARDAVVREMESLGWRTRRRGDGSIVFRGPEAWMGRATLLPSGDLDFDQPAIALQGPRETLGGYNQDAVLQNRYQGGTAGVSLAMPSKEKVDAVQREIRDAVQDEVLDYRHKLQQRYFSGYIDALPSRLDDLWTNGTPLDGGHKPLATAAARRAAVLDFWATRTDTPEGRTVSRSVEMWLRGTVMDGPDAVTREEAVAAEAQRQDGRKLDIFPSSPAARQIRLDE
jgi:hypothetical protein